MATENPQAEALQQILNDEIGRRLFASFHTLNHSKFLEEDALKADSALPMLKEKIFPSIIFCKITAEEKKKMFMDALNINIDNMKSAFEALIDFVVKKQEEHPSMKELYYHLESIAPRRDKK